ncbi:MAG: WhiB family transcriptional regulator [Acidimicrobiales bacterium]
MAAGELFAFREWDNYSWTAEAQCGGMSEIFFPPAAERPQARERREAQAREVCGACAVVVDCRDFARRHREYGFWGGESEEERHAAGFRLIAPIGVRTRNIS